MTFRVGSCRVGVGIPFLTVVALMLALDRSGMAFAGLVCAAAHEAAHIFAMRALGELPEQMRFTAFGIDLVREEKRRSYYRDALVSLAGPAANLACAGFCLCLPGGRQSFYFAASLVLFVLNILPITPLDGGQALRSVLCARIGQEKAERVVTAVSFVTLVPLAAAGFFTLLRTRWNFTLLLVVCYLTALLLLKRER